MYAFPEWQYYGCLLLYIQASMADDLPVFFASAAGQRRNHPIPALLASDRRGTVLMAIGMLMLLRPEWLMFG